MATDDVVVVGVGLMTAVGLGAAETAASVRARVARFAESGWADAQGEAIKLAQVAGEGLPDLEASLDVVDVSRRTARLLKLAALPLQEAVAPLAPSGILPGLCVAIPNAVDDDLPPPEALLVPLVKQSGVAFDPSGSKVIVQGRAGGLNAFAEACGRVRSGATRFALAAGVDSYRRYDLLSALDVAGRLKSDHNLDGFIPGEGAGVILVGSRAAAQAANLKPLAVVTATAQGFEEGHLASDQPYRGDGLATTVTKLLEQAKSAEPIREVYASMNGENHWGREWGVAFLRNKKRFAEDHRIHHPADCFGDLGAAFGPALVALASVGLRDGYRRGPCLVYCSSDDGPRAAVLLTAP